MQGMTFKGRFGWKQERLSTGVVVSPVTSSQPWPGSPETYVVAQVYRGGEPVGRVHCRTTGDPEVMEVTIMNNDRKKVAKDSTWQRPDEKSTMEVASQLAGIYLDGKKGTWNALRV